MPRRESLPYLETLIPKMEKEESRYCSSFNRKSKYPLLLLTWNKALTLDFCELALLIAKHYCSPWIPLCKRRAQFAKALIDKANRIHSMPYELSSDVFKAPINGHKCCPLASKRGDDGFFFYSFFLGPKDYRNDWLGKLAAVNPLTFKDGTVPINVN
ncbi:hypothetical protein KL944_001230 [Ogataea haglerorum]|nr:hypothetical protein KL944_001230 [Ogataea haglerorum]